MTPARGLFVIGTNTEVGKTIFCAALVQVARARGFEAGYFKPVATGGEERDGLLVSPDAWVVSELGELPGSPAELSAVCLRPPLAPLAAARKEGVELEIPAILRDCQVRLGASPLTVVEGVGGLMVPIAAGATVLELVIALDLPCLVIGRPGLGTINHTALTLKALHDAGVQILGFAFSESNPVLAGADPSVADNPGLVTGITGAPYLGTLSHIQPLTGAALRAGAARLPLDRLWRRLGLG